MSHYVLVHGAWEESRIWENVSPVLEANGHRVSAIDLPGHGKNPLPLAEVTMENYVQATIDTIQQIDDKVILVGHSMAGAVISQIAERIPKRIEKLVYVAAFLLKDGGSVLEAMQSDLDGEFLREIVFSEDQSYATAPEQALRSVGFHDVEEGVIQRVLPWMDVKQATEPFMAGVNLSLEHFGSVPKIYIRTNLDKVASPALQETMTKNWNLEAVHDLRAGHFPAFSMPRDLAMLLLEAAAGADITRAS